jgi:non-ribosomal peptide synthase protein (TIGR01720 family)
VFQHKTVEALATVVTFTTDEPTTHDDGQGTIPLTPVMLELQRRAELADGPHQTMVVWTPAELDLPGLTQAVQAVLDQHAGLRLELPGDRLTALPPGRIPAEAITCRVDASDGTDAIREHAEAAIARLDPRSGIMLQAVWFDAGPRELGRLLLVAHHLSVDAVSWRILLTDLAEAWQAVAAGRAPRLDPVPTSFRSWATALAAAANDPVRTAELPWWTGQLGRTSRLSTRWSPRSGDPGSPGQLRMVLPEPTTDALLRAVQAAFHADLDDVLLTALVLAVADWCRTERITDVGDNAVLIDLERHGREADVVPGADLSRTVGWFTSVHPVRLDPGRVHWTDIRSGGPGIGQALKRIKEQLRAVPDHGIGYGMLRHLNKDTGPVLAGLGGAPLALNYLGRVADSAVEPWAAVPDDDAGHGTPTTLAHPVEIDAIVRDGAAGPRLVTHWAWAGSTAEADVRGLAEAWFRALDALVRCAGRTGSGGRTPSDLDLVSLTQDEIDQLESEWGR